jgi:hypothetical protein
MEEDFQDAEIGVAQFCLLRLFHCPLPNETDVKKCETAKVLATLFGICPRALALS